jgi:hypothetical protein
MALKGYMTPSTRLLDCFEWVVGKRQKEMLGCELVGCGSCC